GIAYLLGENNFVNHTYPCRVHERAYFNSPLALNPRKRSRPEPSGIGESHCPRDLMSSKSVPYPQHSDVFVVAPEGFLGQIQAKDFSQFREAFETGRCVRLYGFREPATDRRSSYAISERGQSVRNCSRR